MALSTFPIQGIPPASGQTTTPLRQEITEWVNNDENQLQVSLYLRALRHLMEKPVEDPIGFFQVAGIHSYPLVPWDGVGNPGDKTRVPGFCNHNLVTFPTWHRPYMLLYEQVLYESMLDLIKEWHISEEEKLKWLDAASRFRLPYWDWARKQTYVKNYGIPEICTRDTWDIVKPGTNGAKEAFNNPLTGFKNPKRGPDGERVPMGDPLMGKNAIPDDKSVPSEPLPWSQCIGVSRYGLLYDEPPSEWENGVNKWQYSNAAIADPQWYDQHTGPLKSSTYADAVSRMFSPGYFDSWEAFASTVHNRPTQTTNYMSLEYIHNVIHNGTGGGYFKKSDIPDKHVGFTGLGLGHMADPVVAAFDPIFWLHHCNVDRLLAMWQALNWDMWFDRRDEYPDDPTPSDPLLPFHHDTVGQSWTSELCRDWRKSNYQYDDLRDMPKGKPTPEFQVELRKHIAELYPSTSFHLKAAESFPTDQDTFNDYVINVVYDRYALNGRAYSILFYIGDPELPFSASKNDPNYVGQVYTFGSPVISADGTTTCDNCGRQQAAKVLSKAQIPLTLPLVRRISKIRQGFSSVPGVELGRLDPHAVESVLKYGLKWHFVALGGKEFGPEHFPRTEVAVLHGQGAHPGEEEILPRFGGYSKLTHATEKVPLGFNNEIGPDDLIDDD